MHRQAFDDAPPGNPLWQHIGLRAPNAKGRGKPLLPAPGRRLTVLFPQLYAYVRDHGNTFTLEPRFENYACPRDWRFKVPG